MFQFPQSVKTEATGFSFFLLSSGFVHASLSFPSRLGHLLFALVAPACSAPVEFLPGLKLDRGDLISFFYLQKGSRAPNFCPRLQNTSLYLCFINQYPLLHRQHALHHHPPLGIRVPHPSPNTRQLLSPTTPSTQSLPPLPVTSYNPRLTPRFLQLRPRGRSPHHRSRDGPRHQRRFLPPSRQGPLSECLRQRRRSQREQGQIPLELRRALACKLPGTSAPDVGEYVAWGVEMYVHVPLDDGVELKGEEWKGGGEAQLGDG